MNLSERELIERIQRKYKEEEWLFLHHLRNATGYISAGLRVADAMAFNLWPSRGCEIHGFEVKCRRADFLKELRKPAKAESTGEFCDRWWLVTDTNVAKAEEVPETWGWMLPRGRGLTIARTAQKRERVTLIDSWFMASVLQAYRSQFTDARALRLREFAAFDRGKRVGKREQTQRVTDLEETETLLRREIKVFQEETGLYVSNPPQAGPIIRFLGKLRGQGWGSWVGTLQDFLDRTDKLRKDAEEVLEKYEVLTEASNGSSR